jgi:hypothetical protein
MECEKGPGRLTTRKGQGVARQALPLEPRWRDSGVHTLVVLQRHTVTRATQHATEETASSLSNQRLRSAPHAQAMAFAGAIRQHGHVESDHWLREVTLAEEHVKTPAATQAHGLGCVRSLALRVLRRGKVHNLQEARENFADCPSKFEALLRQVKFL